MMSNLSCWKGLASDRSGRFPMQLKKNQLKILLLCGVALVMGGTATQVHDVCQSVTLWFPHVKLSKDDSATWNRVTAIAFHPDLRGEG